jgi:hypothetical protein
MPTRIIRDGILTSERINSLSPNAELFYRRLMSVADDHGRYAANLTQLRAFCYPLKLDSVKEDSIKKHLAECVDAGLVVLYTVDGKAYLQMLDFGQRINGKSRYPEPPESVLRDSPEFPGDSRLGGDEGGDEDEGGGVVATDDKTAMLAAYHACLPACQEISVLNEKRQKRIRAAVKLAKQVCKSQGWPYTPLKFWTAYFTECAADPWLRGDKPNPNNANWKQNLDVLLAEDRFAEIMDKAIAAAKRGVQ